MPGKACDAWEGGRREGDRREGEGRGGCGDLFVAAGEGGVSGKRPSWPVSCLMLGSGWVAVLRCAR